MDNMHYLMVGLLVIAIVISALTYLKPIVLPTPGLNQSTSLSSIDTILLEGTSIPAGGYLHIMDISPEQVVIGHLALKVPCNLNGTSSVVLLLGSAPNFQAIQLNQSEELNKISTGGQLCIYHFYVGEGYSSPANLELTDAALFNSGNSTIVFPATSTAVISLNKVTPA